MDWKEERGSLDFFAGSQEMGMLRVTVVSRISLHAVPREGGPLGEGNTGDSS